MAAFTTMALLAGGMLAGAGAAKLASKKKTPATDAPLAPGPTQAAAQATPATPVVNPSEAQATANAAGVKARKRAAAGSLVTNQIGPKSSTMPVPPRTRPRTLIGGY